VISLLDVEEARAELCTCSDADIEKKTAEAWMARAIAGYELARERRCVRWLARATSYHHEASEHAAGHSPALLAQIEQVLTVCKLKTFCVLGG
jgi:hypothetical protein